MLWPGNTPQTTNSPRRRIRVSLIAHHSAQLRFCSDFILLGTYGTRGMAIYESISSIIEIQLGKSTGDFKDVPKGWPENQYCNTAPYRRRLGGEVQDAGRWPRGLSGCWASFWGDGAGISETKTTKPLPYMANGGTENGPKSVSDHSDREC
ncbi:hypothetical protein BU24DRAFT_403876 [Aaosphaeria arxii CBS 175.79]|uniref:Uncharacterized protein n=1 Tax=Aaosphaeria arxii CBS 175.79 TaxID=1450172 RepID=A0A6A5Y6G5_9PLEO|nr:uncharacterized protein BU24DRAFT_403876 [Aaosphaeria arxii CBS 175.79]KAF2020803.1 hypothetical protein BU24DRAFT_403876 [Aaosphaeria arxii CBS 175.79]